MPTGRCPMIRESYRVLIALLALTAYVSVGRADSVSVHGSCLACTGFVNVFSGEANEYAYPIYFSGTSGMSDHPEIAAEFQSDVAWVLVFDTVTGRFNTASSDGDFTISGRITSFNLTTSPVLHQPLVYFWTATDSVQLIDQAGQTINILQTGATGSGVIGGTVALFGSIDLGFDLPETPVPEPPAAIPEPSVVLLLLSGGLPILCLFRKFTNSF